ncbi:MAG: hypothetical protein LBB14_03925 [Puniceicoccales bacterium]|nr:hypothetical protein [Puniceicoccales bacterium]
MEDGKTKRSPGRRKAPAKAEFDGPEPCRSVQETHRLLREAGKCELFEGKLCSAIDPASLRIVARANVGWGNWLAIRGRGAGLRWDRGIPLKNEGPDTWSWEGEGPVECKLLLNDVLWERGENHICHGPRAEVSPNF